MAGVEICRYMDAPSARENRQEAFQGTAKYISDNLGPNDKAVLPLSGGVDSSTVLEICKIANVSDRILPVHIDTGYMRKGESAGICDRFSGYKNFQLLELQDFFYKHTFGIEDAEEKRNGFKYAYFTALSEFRKRNGCTVLIDGTIKPDIEETEDGVKGQHNVGIEKNYGAKKVIQPLANQAKPDVRIFAEMAGIDHLRQPFPGPGDMVRTPGAINLQRLKVGKEVDYIVKTELEKYFIEKQGVKMKIGPNGEQTPFQYFAATFIRKEHDRDHTMLEAFAEGYIEALGIDFDYLCELGTMVTGKSPDNKRIYADAICVDGRMGGKIKPKHWSRLAGLAGKDIDDEKIARVLLNITHYSCHMDADYDVAIRAVDSTDARTATVSDVEPEFLNQLAQHIENESDDRVGSVYYDITPKPPSTIEFE